MHTEQIGIARDHYEKEIPRSWVSGGTDYQKASVLAAVAWHQIKDAGDPELQYCDLAHRETCLGIAQSIMAGNVPDNLPFAMKVAELWKEATETKGDLQL